MSKVIIKIKKGTVYRVYDEDYRSESDRLFDRVDDEKLKQFLFNFEKQATEAESEAAEYEELYDKYN